MTISCLASPADDGREAVTGCLPMTSIPRSGGVTDRLPTQQGPRPVYAACPVRGGLNDLMYVSLRCIRTRLEVGNEAGTHDELIARR